MELYELFAAVAIQEQLATGIIDNAREQSAVFGKISITVLKNNNLTVARVSKDSSASWSWVAEGDLIPESSAEFTGVNLEGKTLDKYVPITEQLLVLIIIRWKTGRYTREVLNNMIKENIILK